jgi:hypothetical protein
MFQIKFIGIVDIANSLPIDISEHIIMMSGEVERG